MKKLYTLLALCLIVSGVSGQAFQKGRILIDAGVGFGIYGSSAEVRASNQPAESSSDAAATTLIPITAEYGVNDKIGVGLYLQPGNFLFDKDSSDLTSARAFSIGLYGAYHLLDHESTDLYFNLGPGYSTLNMKWDINDVKQEAKFGGAHFKFAFGMRKFFSSSVGMFARLGYNFYNYSLNELTQDGEEQDLSEFEANATFSGAEIKVGLAIGLN